MSRLAAVVLIVLAGLLAPPATAAPTDRPNPLAGGTWGVYTGVADGVYPAYEHADGRRKRLLAKVARRPRVRWFGSWIPTRDIEDRIRDYVVTTQDGDPDVLIQLAIFRLWPRSEANKDEPLTRHDRRGYRRWVRAAAAGIGRSRVAMVLEPDLAVAFNGWRPAVRLRLTAYAAKVFGALPHTTVYLEAGDSDWLRVPKAVGMMRRAGLRHADGFALGATHYSTTPAQIRYAAALSDALAEAGFPGKRAVIDTADNGRGFTWPQYWAKHPRGDFNNAETCRTRASRRCVTLGIPPT